jgi:hypothetical protein
MMRAARSFWLGCGVMAAVAGCGSVATPKDYTPTQARLFLESADRSAPSVRLPTSGAVVAVSPKAIITEGDIVDAEVMQVELGRCLLLRLTPTAARDLYRLTVVNQGRRLVLTLNDVALGARVIDAPLAEGAVLIFVEVPEAELPALVRNLKLTSAELQRAIARKS